MAWTAMTDDICTQTGVKVYDFFASGTIKKGQGVCLTMQSGGTFNKSDLGSGSSVYVPDFYEAGTNHVCNASCQRCIGIADYDATNRSAVAIWGPYNLCKARISGEGAVVAVGTWVGLTWDGYFSPLVSGNTAAAMGISGSKTAVVVEAPAANLGIGKVLLY
jgi:hypothetical protein